jgi:1,2-phenylacetyl-CoA epoxidase PaaB subunit
MNKENKKLYDLAYRAAHKKEQAIYNATYKAAHKEEQAAYNAVYRGTHKEEHKAYGIMHKEEQKAYSLASEIRRKERYSVWRAAAIGALGGKCVCCGETEPAFLEFDHVNDDGYRHRKEKGYRTWRFFASIIEDTCMYKVQILCANCNRAKEVLGICPHQRMEA